MRKGSTRSDDYPLPKKIIRWKEFRWSTLRGMFENRMREELSREVEALPGFDEFHPAFLRVCDEDSLTSILVKSHQSIVLEGLRQASDSLLEQRVEMVKGGQGYMVHKRRSQKPFKPDWAGICSVSNDSTRPRNILPGETKISSSWKSSDIPSCLKGDGNVRPEQMHKLWPLRQILAYCLDFFARYGYIITDKELFVLRVRPVHETLPSGIDSVIALREAMEESALIEYASIPWDNERSDRGITMNLALWMLHILAANNGDLESTEYAPLAEERVKCATEKRSIPPLISSFEEIGPSSQEENDSIHYSNTSSFIDPGTPISSNRRENWTTGSLASTECSDSADIRPHRRPSGQGPLLMEPALSAASRARNTNRNTHDTQEGLEEHLYKRLRRR